MSMQSPEASSLSNIASLSQTTQKRKRAEQSKNPHSNDTPSTFSGSGSTFKRGSSSNDNHPRSEPAAKRIKVTVSSSNTKSSADMNRGSGATSKTRVIDLTKPSNFQPQSGAKRLVVKNLRAISLQNTEIYYEKLWRQLDDALILIFNGEELRSPLEVLCRGVEATCRNNKSHALFELLRDRSKSYLEDKMLPDLQRDVGVGNVGVLRTVQRYWTKWNKKSVSFSSDRL